MVIGRLDQSRHAWRMDYLHKNYTTKQNHDPADILEGYAYARRLTRNKFRLVQELTNQDIEPRKIWNAITEQNPENKFVLNDIHNARQEISHYNYLIYWSLQK
ncbi:hypothetical protein HanXRQr2_Chr05g0219021 [Helianthus annuus]|uniref:Uncharacterized protein n=1 Tax=Helianthus annuus TaxID=4232 RepID=A0A9K3J0I1_HELAN|nr:hypothetical protein HanXRQr2_Chr05g0219021 [Helianthus annuus]KAJ0923076.1 hypothetical protein HanPSC8_Chr05g0211431 [Helianthus annuus]